MIKEFSEGITEYETPDGIKLMLSKTRDGNVIRVRTTMLIRPDLNGSSLSVFLDFDLQYTKKKAAEHELDTAHKHDQHWNGKSEYLLRHKITETCVTPDDDRCD